MADAETNTGSDSEDNAAQDTDEAWPDTESSADAGAGEDEAWPDTESSADAGADEEEFDDQDAPQENNVSSSDSEPMPEKHNEMNPREG